MIFIFSVKLFIKVKFFENILRDELVCTINFPKFNKVIYNGLYTYKRIKYMNSYVQAKEYYVI